MLSPGSINFSKGNVLLNVIDLHNRADCRVGHQPTGQCLSDELSVTVAQRPLRTKHLPICLRVRNSNSWPFLSVKQLKGRHKDFCSPSIRWPSMSCSNLIGWAPGRAPALLFFIFYLFALSQLPVLCSQHPV